MTKRKPQDKNDLENIVAHIVFISPKHPELGEYECVGALVRDEKDMVRIAFSAKNDIVEDYLDIQRADIVSIEILNTSEIEKL